MKKKILSLVLAVMMIATMGAVSMASAATDDTAVIKDLINKNYNAWLEMNNGSTVRLADGTPVCALQFTPDGAFNVYFYDYVSETLAANGGDLTAVAEALKGAGTGIIATLNSTLEQYKALNPDATALSVSLGNTEIPLYNGSLDLDALVKGVGEYYGEALKDVDAEATADDYRNALKGMEAGEMGFTVKEGETVATQFTYSVNTTPVRALTQDNTADANNQTEVTYYEAPTYAVIIPKAVTLDSKGIISASDMKLAPNTQVAVSVVEGDNTTMFDAADKTKFAVEQSDDKLGYTIKVGEIISESTPAYSVGATLCTFDQAGNATLNFSAPMNEAKYAGVYSGTLEFSIALASK